MFNIFSKKRKAVKNPLNIIIVGLGRVGKTLTEKLSEEGHDVTVIDADREVVEEVTGLYDVNGIIGNGASFEVQSSAGVNDVDLVLAVTESDEINLLTCVVARKTHDCSTIARVRTPEYADQADYLRAQLKLERTINPEESAAKEMVRLLKLPKALSVTSFAHGECELVKFLVPEDSMLTKITIAELGNAISVPFLICVVERDGEVIIPGGDFQLLSGDKTYLAATGKAARVFFKKAGINMNPVKDVIIIGGGSACYYLAKRLLASNTEVKIIEKDMQRCEKLSEVLPKATIIHGEGTDEDLLLEEGIADAGAVIPLTGFDEENILLSLYAKKVSSARTITKINHIKFNSVIETLDLDSVVYPRYLTTERVTAYARAKSAARSSNIATLSHIADESVEAIEFIVDSDNKVVGKKISELKLEKDVLIGFIYRKGSIIIPSGSDEIMYKDSVLIVTKNKGYSEIDDILES